MKVLSLEKTPQNQLIKQAVRVLKTSGLIIYPTETSYGLGADATSPKAVSKVIEYKGERKGKPISVAVSDSKMAKKYIKINPTAKNIFKNLLPGPITIVCEGKHKVDPRVEAETGTLGVRIPDHKLFLEISKKFRKPITATSANISGKKPPYAIEDIIQNLTNTKKELLSLVIDAGPLPKNPPSTVIDTTLDQPEIIRQGKIDFSRLNAKSVISNNQRETIKFANNLTEKHVEKLGKNCLVFALQGELGTGKTRFAKGVGKALGIKEIINSPTFDLIREYPYQTKGLRGTFFHIDTWRIRSSNELNQLGFKKMLKPGNVVLIEWIEKGKQTLDRATKNKPVKIIWIKIDHIDQNKRRIKFTD